MVIENICYAAVCSNNYRCLVYAHRNGCQLVKNLPDIARRNNNDQMLDYLIENQCSCSIDTILYHLALK